MEDTAGPARAGWMARGEQEVPESGAWLAPDESTLAAGMRFTKRRSEYLLRRWVCKQAVAVATGLPTDSATLSGIRVLNHPTGAPYVVAEGAPPGLEVALTDRAGWAVCLVGTAMGRLGCDLELVESRSPGFVADFLTAFERDWVHARPATDRDAGANLIWSAKESALKVLQVGLRRDTRSVEVGVGGAGALSTGADGMGQDAMGEDGWFPLEVRPAEGGVLPGWWRRGGRFLLTVVTECSLPPPSVLAGSRALEQAEPTHGWVDRPVTG
jgi:4'-phosphopantetheinyl transferase